MKKIDASGAMRIKVSLIKFSKTNPRKNIDTAALNELAESIKQVDVIQPIIVRPLGDKDGNFELVVGERRVRASEIAGKEDIPAYIREMTDDEVIQVQIIENLQRENVNAMDEALGMKTLLTSNTFDEVAAKLGKSVYYIRQRLKLTDLGTEGQTLVRKGALKVSEALQLAMLPVKDQLDILKQEVDLKQLDKAVPFEIGNWRFNRYRGNLNAATFSLTDPKLVPAAGPCSACQFNTATASLFPDQAASSTCSNVSCFNKKTDLQFKIELDKCLEDPTIIFVIGAYSSSNDKTILAVKEKGHQVYTHYNDYSEIEAPVYPNIDEFKDEYMDDESTEEEIQTAFSKEVANYEKYKAEYDKKIASGKYNKAFCLSGNDKGRYIYVELKKKTSGSSQAANKKNSITTQDIDDEITRLNDREKRSKELDGEKVHQRIVDDMKKLDPMSINTPDMRINDKLLIKFLLCDNVHYINRAKAKKILGVDITEYKAAKLHDTILAMSDDQAGQLARMITIDKFLGNLPQTKGGFMVRKIADHMGGIPIAAYEQEQKEKADKRIVRVNQRIAELKKQKKEIEDAAKTKKETGTKKSPAK